MPHTSKTSFTKIKANQWKRFHFIQLSAFLDSGMDAASALEQLVKQDKAHLAPLIPHIHQLKKGQSFSKTLYRAGIIDPLDYQQLTFSEACGQLAPELKKLAITFDKRMSAAKQVKSQLMMPFTTYFIAVCVGAVLMSQKDASVAQVLFFLIGWLAFGFTVRKLILSILISNPLKWLNRTLNYAWLRNHTMVIRLYEYYWLRLLHTQLKSGMDILSSLKNLSTLFSAHDYQQKMQALKIDIQAGKALTNHLEKHGIITSHTSLAVLNSAEISGSLEHALAHYLEQQKDLIEQNQKSFTTWIPRVIYALIVMFMLNILL